MEVGFKIEDGFSPALLRAYDDSKWKPDIARSINHVMARWVGFAMAKIPRADKRRIKARLEGKAAAAGARFQQGFRKTSKSGRESRSARYLVLRDSVAAYICYLKNRAHTERRVKGFVGPMPQLKARSMNADQFYAAVGRWVGARQYSAGYLRSALRPALNEFRVRLGLDERGPQYRKGTMGSARKAQPQEAIATADVEAYVDALGSVSPRAFLESLPEITTMVEQWIGDNMAKRAAAEGILGRG